MPRIKICGVTRVEDALAAAKAGASAIGLLFVPGSPRYLSHDQAKQILRGLPPLIVPVGVFMDQSITDVTRIAYELGLRTVQLHGQEPIEAVQALAPLAVIKGLAARDESIYDDINRWTAAGVAAILLDKPRTAARSDPAPMPHHLLTPEAIQEHCGHTAPLILAGGLTPDNVAQAVRLVQPYGVDVSSGVESTPGIKDQYLIERFVLGATQ